MCVCVRAITTIDIEDNKSPSIIRNGQIGLVCLSGLTALVNVKMIEMTNQIKVGGVYCSQKQSKNSSSKCQFNIEIE